MSIIEWSLLCAILAHSVAVVAAAIKLISWVARTLAVQEERIRQLRYQLDNDVTGRRVVGEMREDLAAIKVQIVDIRDDIKRLHEK